MNHFKSWSYLQKQLDERLCEALQDRVSYFLTYYHEVHDSYGRAAIRLDGKELAVFSWIDECKQERDVSERWQETGVYDGDAPELKMKWEQEGTLSVGDFVQAATDFLQMPITDALESDNCQIRILAVLDRRVGKRRLRQLQDSELYKSSPAWVRQFYELRFEG